MTNAVARTYAWLVILGRFGTINNIMSALGLTQRPVKLLYTEGAVIVGLSQLFMPLMILTLVSAMENIRPDVIQAARSLGASNLKTFFKVNCSAFQRRLGHWRRPGFYRQHYRVCHSLDDGGIARHDAQHLITPESDCLVGLEYRYRGRGDHVCDHNRRQSVTEANTLNGSEMIRGIRSLSEVEMILRSFPSTPLRERYHLPYR